MGSKKSPTSIHQGWVKTYSKMIPGSNNACSRLWAGFGPNLSLQSPLMLYMGQKWVRNGLHTRFSGDEPEPPAVLSPLRVDFLRLKWGPIEIKWACWGQKNGSETCFFKGDPPSSGLLRCVGASFDKQFSEVLLGPCNVEQAGQGRAGLEANGEPWVGAYLALTPATAGVGRC